MTTPTPDVEAARDVWRDEVVATIGPLLAGRDLSAGGSFVKVAEEVADALRPLATALRAAPQPEGYRPCAGCDAVGESCRAVGCPAVTPAPQPDDGALTEEERDMLVSARRRPTQVLTTVERILAARAAQRDPQPSEAAREARYADGHRCTCGYKGTPDECAAEIAAGGWCPSRRVPLAAQPSVPAPQGCGCPPRICRGQAYRPEDCALGYILDDDVPSVPAPPKTVEAVLDELAAVTPINQSEANVQAMYDARIRAALAQDREADRG